jgi:hypothetical protein
LPARRQGACLTPLWRDGPRFEGNFFSLDFLKILSKITQRNE